MDINMSEQISLFRLLKFDNEPNENIPSGISLVKKQLWCPYCSNIVTFKKDKKSGVKKCPICNISEKDFWVKKINRL